MYDYYYYDYLENATAGDGATGDLGPLDPPNSQTSTVPPFRFASVLNSDKSTTTRRPVIPVIPAQPSRQDTFARGEKPKSSDDTDDEDGRYSSLSELIAQLRGSQDDPAPPVSNTLFNSTSSHRDAKVLSDTFATDTTGTLKPFTSQPVDSNPSMKVHVTNSTESSVIIASVQTSHSVSINENIDVTTSTPFMPSSTKTEGSTPFVGTTEELPDSATPQSLSGALETINVAPGIISGPPDTLAVGRPPKHLDDFPDDTNKDVIKPEKSDPIIKVVEEELRPRIETLFDIEINTKNQTVIATDARLDSLSDITHVEDISSFLPPDYKVEESSSQASTTTPTTSPATSPASNSSQPEVDEIDSSLNESDSVLMDHTTEGGVPSSTLESPTTTTNSSLDETFPAVQFTSETSTTEAQKNPLEGISKADVSAFLPPDFKPSEEPTENSTEATLSSTTETSTVVIPEVKTVDPSLFLPPGYSPSEEPQTEATTKVIPVVHTVDPSAFLPPGFKPSEDAETESPIIKTVDVSKFLPPGYTTTEESTTEATTKKLPVVETVDVSKFLPPGFKLNATTELPEVQTVDISKFLPPGFKLSTTEAPVSEVPTAKTVDISQFLPPGYKLSTSEAPVTPQISTSKPFDISQFLPEGYKLSTTEEPTSKSSAVQVDISQFLPPSYKLNETEEKETPKVEPFDISKFLPTGYKLGAENSETPPSTTTEAPTTTEKLGPKGLVFPRRPKYPAYLTTTPKPATPEPSGPPPVKPTFRNLWER